MKREEKPCQSEEWEEFLSAKGLRNTETRTAFYGFKKKSCSFLSLNFFIIIHMYYLYILLQK